MKKIILIALLFTCKCYGQETDPYLSEFDSSTYMFYQDTAYINNLKGVVRLRMGDNMSFAKLIETHEREVKRKKKVLHRINNISIGWNGDRKNTSSNIHIETYEATVIIDLEAPQLEVPHRFKLSYEMWGVNCIDYKDDCPNKFFHPFPYGTWLNNKK